MPKDPKTGRYLAVKDGGVYEEPRPVTKPKFPDEDRAMYGIAAPTMLAQPTWDGAPTITGAFPQRVGIKVPRFDYTGKKVVGPAAHALAFKAEVKRVVGLQGVWKRYQKVKANDNDRHYMNPYQARYADTNPTQATKLWQERFDSWEEAVLESTERARKEEADALSRA